MRLLNARRLINDGVAKLVEYVDERSLPPYAILSHTWGNMDEEVLFEDVESRTKHLMSANREADGISSQKELYVVNKANVETVQPYAKAGWDKVYRAARQAYHDGFDLVWIDTCCIDKRSSAELSEAINSMFRWYKKAAVCYVYLVDFNLNIPPDNDWHEHSKSRSSILNEREVAELCRCRWFTRGWTLQELIAPQNVQFYDQSWKYVAHKRDLLPTLETITGIHASALDGWRTVAGFSVAQRMSWASKRTTTRIEDEAYCLLGLFEVNMPLLYGEGKRAFRRLQDAIISASSDTTIFAWELLPGDEKEYGHALFAPSVAHFWWHAREMIYYRPFFLQNPFEDHRLTNQGLHIRLQIHRWRRDHDCRVVFAYLNCVVQIEKDTSSQMGQVVGLRISNRYQSSTSLVHMTHVRPEEVSSPSKLDENALSHRRLVILEPENEDTYTTADEIWPLLIGISNPKGYQALLSGISDRGNVRVCLQLPTVTPTRKWRISTAYPNFQWNSRDCSFTFTMSDGVSNGIIVIEIEDGIRCIVAVGAVHDRRDSGNSFRHNGRGYFQYWIFPCPTRQNTSSWNLKKMSEQIASFAGKDVFEHNANRQKANKAIVLPNGDVVRISPVPSASTAGGFEGDVETSSTDARTSPPTTNRWEDRTPMLINVNLRLRVDKGGGGAMASLPEYDKLKVYHGMPISDKSTWDRPLDLAIESSAGRTVRTQAWQFHEEPWRPKVIKSRFVDFNAAIFDRRLWNRGSSLAEMDRQS